MPEISFSGLVIVAAVAFAAPLMLGLFPRVRLPAVVLEIVLGIVIGPSVLGWVEPDLAIRVLALLGLAFLLLLAGLEVDLERLRGRLLRLAGSGFAASIVLAAAIGAALQATGQVRSAGFVGIVLLATSLGLVVPVLKDAGLVESEFGQLVVAGGTVADFGAVILLSLFYSRESTGTGTRVVLLGAFVLLLTVIGFVVGRAGRSMRLSAVLLRLQDTTAQIRVRGAVVLLVGFVALAERFGLETILGAFMAGVILRLVDRDAMMTHPNFRVKLEGIGYGFLIPVFFVSSGVSFDGGALFSSASTILRVPLFLAALLVVRGLPALAYRGVASSRRVAAAGLLQATSLPFIVAATQIGMDIGTITQATGAAFVAAGLLSVLIFPIVAVTLLKGEPAEASPARTGGSDAVGEPSGPGAAGRSTT
jgi:Kef-type K+ transport system membrane component KefB